MLLHSAHWREFYAITIVICVLGTLQGFSLQADVTSDELDGEVHRNSRDALVIEDSGALVLNPMKHRNPPLTPDLEPTPDDLNEFETTTTTLFNHQPLPSSDYFPMYDDTVTQSMHMPTERLVVSETSSDPFPTDLSDFQSQDMTQWITSTPALRMSSSQDIVDAFNSSASISTSFHTPLMSLLMSTSSVPAAPEVSISWNNLLMTTYSNASDNDSVFFNHAPVFESDNRKLLMLVLRAEDCEKFNKVDFERMLSNLLERYGFGDAVPQVSTAKCYSHLTITLTVNNSVPTLRFLHSVDSKSNVTVDVLNKTFRIIKLEKVDMRLQKPKHNSTSGSIITSITKHESVAYIALGVCFGLILLVCSAICCFKICFGTLPQPRRRRLRTQFPKHERLGPDDYVLRPLPAASNALNPQNNQPKMQVSSSNVAGSASGTTSSSREGVVQSGETSIIPLEDSSSGAAAAVPNKDSDQTPGKSHSQVDAKTELNNMKNISKKEQSGVTNPTFQRY